MGSFSQLPAPRNHRALSSAAEAAANGELLRSSSTHALPTLDLHKGTSLFEHYEAYNRAPMSSGSFASSPSSSATSTMTSTSSSLYSTEIFDTPLIQTPRHSAATQSISPSSSSMHYPRESMQQPLSPSSDSSRVLLQHHQMYQPQPVHSDEQQYQMQLQQLQIQQQRREKLERHHARLEKKQRKEDYKKMYQEQFEYQKYIQERELAAANQLGNNTVQLPFKSYSMGLEARSQQAQMYPGYHPSEQASRLHDLPYDNTLSSADEKVRSHSLKTTTKTMYDLRPWSAAPMPSRRENNQHYQGYESDETDSHGWDSLMDTLHSPTISTHSDVLAWEAPSFAQAKVEKQPEIDLAEQMGNLNLTAPVNDNGNGKYMLVLGANGRTGLELVRQALIKNYRVTAFVRDDRMLIEDHALRKHQNLLIVRGSPTNQVDMDLAVEGQDVVVNVIGARLTSGDASIGSHSQVVLNNSMKKCNVRRLIVVTSYGCIKLRDYQSYGRRIFSHMFMSNIIKDKELQEDIIRRAAGVDWTIVRPITLKDGNLTGRYWVKEAELPKSSKLKALTRKNLAHYILSTVNRTEDFGAVRSIAGRSKSTTPMNGYHQQQQYMSSMHGMNGMNMGINGGGMNMHSGHMNGGHMSSMQLNGGNGVGHGGHVQSGMNSVDASSIRASMNVSNLHGSMLGNGHHSGSSMVANNLGMNANGGNGVGGAGASSSIGNVMVGAGVVGHAHGLMPSSYSQGHIHGHVILQSNNLGPIGSSNTPTMMADHSHHRGR